MGYEVIADSAEVRKFMLEGKINSEWLPIPPKSQAWFRGWWHQAGKDINNPQDNFMMIEADQSTGPRLIPENPADVKELYTKLANEHDMLMKERDLEARMKDMGIDTTQHVQVLQKEKNK